MANDNGIRGLRLCAAHDMTVCNTFFRQGCANGHVEVTHWARLGHFGLCPY